MYEKIKTVYQVIFILYLVFLNTAYAENPSRFPGALPPRAYSPAPPGLVDVQDVVPDIRLDLRYATDNNFIGKPLDGYSAARAFLLPRTAEALARVQQELKAHGFFLKIYDAYRPVRAEFQMIDWAREHHRDDLLFDGYLNANIRVWNTRGHPCGNCVDLTIVDSAGIELDMGTRFDEFTDESMTLQAEGKVLENRLLLKNLMTKHGFRNFYREWWHYTFWNATGPVQDRAIQ